jgi:predicted XRE-type DNA-binding protein
LRSHARVGILKPGGGVLEVVNDYDGNAYRAVYTVRFKSAVYVLHAFQKKSKKGIRTPEHEIDIVRQRLGRAKEIHTAGHVKGASDLAKAELAAGIARIISSKRLTQAAAAKVLHVDQPKVSALLRGRLSGFSTERLLKFLRMLGSDVDIIIRARRRATRVGHLHVLSA